jgi:hypothetical protein
MASNERAAPTSAFLLLDGPIQPLLARCGAAIDAGLRSSLTPVVPFRDAPPNRGNSTSHRRLGERDLLATSRVAEQNHFLLTAPSTQPAALERRGTPVALRPRFLFTPGGTRIALRHDPSGRPGGDPADERYREAWSLADELGMCPLVAHCHLGLGKLYHRTGDGAKAHEHLTTATAMARGMDMGFCVAQPEAVGGLTAG